MSDEPPERGPSLLIGAPLSLSGRYSLQGRLVAAGLGQFGRDLRTSGGPCLGPGRRAPEIAIVDDGSTGAGVRRALEALAGVNLLIGPYGSDLVGEAGRWAGERGRVIWNHGGNADDVQRSPGLVSVSSPTSHYFRSVLQAVAGFVHGGRVLLAAGRGAFGKGLAEGAHREATRRGMTLAGVMRHADVSDAPDVEVLLLGGSFTDDVALLGRLRRRPPVVAAVAAGLGAFGAQLGGRADGVLGPSQWEEGARFPADVGPHRADVVRALRSAIVQELRVPGIGQHVDYPAAQAYATGLLAVHAAHQAGSFADEPLLAEARRLRCTTFFGRFGIGDDGLQREHQMLVVRWHDGVKVVVWPPALAEAPVTL